jgi:hypothetical protein
MTPSGKAALHIKIIKQQQNMYSITASVASVASVLSGLW